MVLFASASSACPSKITPVEIPQEDRLKARQLMLEVSASNTRDDTESFYRMAQLFAEVGDVDACLYYLGKTLQSGFRDRDRLHKDKAFEALRHTRAFIELVSSYGLQERTT